MSKKAVFRDALKKQLKIKTSKSYYKHELNHRLMKTLTFLVVLLLCSNSIFAQYPDWECFYETTRINTIAQDDESVWAGTYVGIIKINKNTREVTHFNKQNSPIPDDRISNIVVDNSNKKWIATQHGYLYSYDDNDWTIYEVSSTILNGNYIKEMAVDADNSIWITTHYSGLFKFDGTNWSVYNTINSQIPSNLVSSIFYNNEILWAATNLGLAKFDGENWITYISPNTANVSVIMDIVQDVEGNLWLLRSTALEKFDGTEFTLINSNNSNLPEVNLTSMTIDTNGVIWIGCSRSFSPHYPNPGGLLSFSENHWTKYDTVNSGINDTDVYDILADSENNIWFGNTIGHVGKRSGSEWEFYDASLGKLDNNVVKQIITDKFGNAYIGTENPKISGSSLFKTNMNSWITMPYYSRLSLAMTIDKQMNFYIKNEHEIMKFDGSGWTSLPDCPSIFVDNPPFMKPDEMVINDLGHIWIDYCDSVYLIFDPITGNYIYEGYNGIAKYDGIGWTKYTVRNSPLPSGTIYDINIDSQQNIWISTSDGLVKINNLDWTIFNTTNSSLPVNLIRQFAIDSLDNIWFSDTRFGLYMFDQNSVAHFPHPTMSQYSGGGDVVVDIDGSIWQHSKLIRFDGSGWTTFDANNSPLGDYNITSLAVDKYGNKWIGTTFGFLVYKENGVITSPVYKPLPKKELLIYPNPFSENFTLVLGRAYDDVTVTIYDALSRQVFNQTYERTDKIHVSGENLRTGVYLYKVTAGNVIIGTGKVVAGF